MNLGRPNVAIWIITAAVVVTSAVMVWAIIEMRRGAEKLMDRGPSAPMPSAADAAAISLTSSGVSLTVKQRGAAWLPGGKFKLHLDDITGQQVIVSVTDDHGSVVVGPLSVTVGRKFTVSNMEIEVVRLENLLLGSSDFGEFVVKPAL
jgi:hypothetical protein